MGSPPRRGIHRVVPTHWSQLLASVVLASLVVSILSGAYLALFFEPSMSETRYDGPYAPLRGVPMTEAYASALDIRFGVRGGLFVSRLHHWASSLSVASLLVGLAWAFFTGAFRRPRRTAWVAGVLLLAATTFEAFTGVLLQDDGMSGTSLRMISGYLLSVPLVGTWLHGMLFGGEFPGTEVIGRLYFLHLVVLPAVIGLLVIWWVAVLRRVGHPQFPGPGRSEHSIVGLRLWPGHALRATAAAMVTGAVLVAMAGLLEANPIWLYGPADAANVSAGSTPPWYFGWVDGAVRLWPAWDIRFGGHTIPAPFWPSMVFLPVSFAALAAYPWLERRITRDGATHHLLQRPRDVPRRTALGVAVVTFYGCLQLAGGIDPISRAFHLSADGLFWALRVGLFLLPPLAAVITYRLCLGLQQHDRSVLAHGVETGIIRRLPDGGYREEHQPLGAADEHGVAIPLPYAGAPVPKRVNQLVSAAQPAVGGFFRPRSSDRAGRPGLPER
jgi:ubiquinol-cytochrome c reductase cytochrome b subunit